MKWFRAYTSLLRSRKVRRLPAPLFRQWVNVLCVAASGGDDATDWEWGYLPPSDDLAEELSMTRPAAATLLERLDRHGLIDKTDDGRLSPHKWFKRQYRSDDVTARTKKHKAVPGNVPKNGVTALPGTPPETETETDLSSPSEKLAERFFQAKNRGDEVGVLVEVAKAYGQRVEGGIVASALKDHSKTAVMDALMQALGRNAADVGTYMKGVLKRGKAEQGSAGKRKVVTTDGLSSRKDF